MGGLSSIELNGQRITFGDWVRYKGVDYTYFETTDDGDIILRDWRYDWEFVTLHELDFDLRFGSARFICKTDDPRFFIGNNI